MTEKKNIQHEYKEFLSSGEAMPPDGLSLIVLTSTYKKLHANVWLLFAKLSLLHFVSAAITLSVCSQFGVRLFWSGHGLAAYFMFLGDHACMVLCGIFFIGTT